MIAAFTSVLVPVLTAALCSGAMNAPDRSNRSDAAVFFETNGNGARTGTALDLLVVTNPARDIIAVTKTDGDAAVMKRAKALLAGLQAGSIDRSELSPALSADYTATVLANAAKTLPKGTPKEFALRERTDANGTTTYVYRVGWDAGDIDYVFGFDDATYEVTKLFTRPGPPQ
jgi:hypothetical protein